MNRSQKNAVQSAREQVVQERQKLERLEAEERVAQAELSSLERRSGEELLDDLASPSDLALSMGQLRDQVAMLGRAMTAQRSRVKAAEAAYLLSEADGLASAAAAVKQRLEAHEERSGELARQLEEHEGYRLAISSGPALIRLREESKLVETGVEILRLMAQGGDPEAWLQTQVRQTGEGRIDGRELAEFYPMCVREPDALVRAPVFARRDTGAADLRLQHEQHAAELDAEAHAAQRELAAVEAKRAQVEPEVFPRYLADAKAAAEFARNRADAYRVNTGLTPASA